MFQFLSFLGKAKSVCGRHPSKTKPRRRRPRLGLELLEDRILPAASLLNPLVGFVVDNNWGSGFQASVTIDNDQSAPMDDWRLEFDFQSQIDSIWNAQILSHVGTHYVVGNAGWNSTIPTGAQVSFGLIGAPGALPLQPIGYSLSWGSVVAATGSAAPAGSAAAANISADFSVASDWQSGFGANVSLTNHGTAPLDHWTLEFDFSHDITSIWNAQIASHEGSHYVITNASWNGVIAAGAAVSFGFNGAPGNVGSGPTGYVLNGVALGATNPPPTSDTSSTAPATGDSQPGTSTQPTDGSIIPVLSGGGTTTGGTTTSAGTSNDQTLPNPGAGVNAGTESRRVVGYFTEWGIYDRDYQVADVPADQLTHLIYSFANISPQGEVVPFDSWAAIEKPFPGDTAAEPFWGNFNQLLLLKEQHPQMKTLISVGGWTLSGEFSDAALTEESRARFARSAVDFLVRYGFDGIDIDWEYPGGGGLSTNTYRPEDGHDYTLLLAELRRQLDAQGALDGKHYLITVASAAGFDKLANYELAPMAASVDWFNVMTYDYHGAWENSTNQLAPLYSSPYDPSLREYNVDWTIQAYLAAGVPADMVLMGVPLYTRAWEGVPAANGGLYQSSAGAAPGTWEAGMFDYRDIHDRLALQPEVYHRYWDSAAQVPYVYAASVAGGLFSTYEDPESVQAKIGYALQHDLGGIFFWELSGDVRDSASPDSLVHLVAGAFLPQSSIVLAPTLSVGDLTITEGNAGTTNALFTVSLSSAVSNPVTVAYATADGSARADSDYLPASGTLTFAPGTTSLTVAVPVIGDTLAEGTETFQLVLADAAGAGLGRARATATILDNDFASTNTALAWAVQDDWGTGFVASVTIANGQTTDMTGWILEFDFDRDFTSIWNAEIVSHVGNHYVIRSAPWNSTILAGGSVSFGVQGTSGFVTGGLANVLLNGVPIVSR